MNILKRTLAGGLMATTLLTISACGVQGDDTSNTTSSNHSKNVPVPTHVNTDPKKGWVSVFGEKSNIKRCDGPNLVYRLNFNSDNANDLHSQSVIGNAKECQQ